jgi:predicted GNAT family N-acyltransferase
MAVLPKFRGIGVGSHMMEQFLREAADLYEQISVSVLSNSRAVKFYKKFGFWHVENHTNKSVIDGSTVNTMVKKLEKKEIKRPSDGYNPQKWMD